MTSTKRLYIYEYKLEHPTPKSSTVFHVICLLFYNIFPTNKSTEKIIQESFLRNIAVSMLRQWMLMRKKKIKKFLAKWKRFSRCEKQHKQIIKFFISLQRVTFRKYLNSFPLTVKRRFFCFQPRTKFCVSKEVKMEITNASGRKKKRYLQNHRNVKNERKTCLIVHEWKNIRYITSTLFNRQHD